MDEKRPFEIEPGNGYTLNHVANFFGTTERAIRRDLIDSGFLPVVTIRRGKEVALGIDVINCIEKLKVKNGT